MALKVFFIEQEKLMHFPTWIDLKGQDSVPETVHHVVSRHSFPCAMIKQHRCDRQEETNATFLQEDQLKCKDSQLMSGELYISGVECGSAKRYVVEVDEESHPD